MAPRASWFSDCRDLGVSLSVWVARARTPAAVVNGPELS